jgi:glucose/mannose-6-phosphate isomerase
LKEFFQEKNISYRDVYSIKGHILSKIINLIYVLDYATIYHAIISNIDPSPVESINYIKERI